MTHVWEKKMKKAERNHGLGQGKPAREDGVICTANRARIGDEEKEERRMPGSRAQRMGLNEEMEGLGEDGMRVFGSIGPFGEREE